MGAFEVIGYRKVNFQDGDKTITGMSIFVTSEDDNVTGLSAEKIFLSEKFLSATGYKPLTGERIEIMYNKYGKPDNIKVVA